MMTRPPEESWTIMVQSFFSSLCQRESIKDLGKDTIDDVYEKACELADETVRRSQERKPDNPNSPYYKQVPF